MASELTQSSFRRGVLSLVLLGLLQKEDMYGYQLVQEAAKQSGGRIITQEGSLYPVLYKLVDQGMITDRKVQVGKRMTRVYYHLEPAGARRLQELTHEYEEITQGVLQIVKGVVADADTDVSSSLSAGGSGAAAGQLEAEETGLEGNSELRPEPCC